MIAEGNDFEKLIRNETFLQPVIDFGCGNGRLSGLFNASLYLGVDTSLKMVEYAKRSHAGYRFTVVFGGETLPASDTIFANDVMKHIPEAAVRDVFSSFRSDRLIISEVFGDRGFIFYSEIASGFGYELHRCIFVPSPGSKIAFMEFHKMERT